MDPDPTSLSGVEPCWGGSGKTPLLLGTQVLPVLELEVRPAIEPLAPCNTEDSWTLARHLHACWEPCSAGLWKGSLSTYSHCPAPDPRQ